MVIWTDKIWEDKKFQKEALYHNFITELVFGDENPMLLNESNPEKAQELFKKVGELVKRRYHYDVIMKKLFLEGAFDKD
tara:strand:+ start:347 stop:583 length:237 start_codon:yes stop_codon:yes gene_type:complete